MSTEAAAADRVLERVKRVEAIRAWFVLHDGLEGVRRDFVRLHRRDNSHGESGCLLLHGPARSGKTRLILDYVKDHPPTELSDGDRQEVVFVRAPYPCTPKNLVEKIAKELGHPRPSRVGLRGGRMFDLMDVVLHYVRELGVRLMFIDEIHQMIDGRGDAGLRAGATLLKDLINEGEFCIVASGTSAATRIFEAHDELRGRLLAVHELRPFDWYDAAQRDTFRALLDEMDAELPFERSGLADAGTAMRIHVATGGLIGNVARLVESAGVVAAHADAGRIGHDHFAQAYERSRIDKDGPNPFRGGTPDPLPPDAPDPVPERPRGGRRRRADDDFRP